MGAAREKLDDRRAEFDIYSKLLTHLDKRLLPRAGSKRRFGDLPHPDSFKAMKATAFLMLYNIVEATIVTSFAELYQAIADDGCTLNEVTPKIQSLWIEQGFKMSPQSANLETYKKRAAQLLEQTMKEVTLMLSEKDLSLGGNIDAEAARKVCFRHGCDLSVHKRARGGTELDTIKKQRNGLAHGEQTFLECGQSYAVSDIQRIAKECFSFLIGFVRSVDRFIEKRGYLNS